MKPDNKIHVSHVLGNLGMGGAEMGVLRLIESFPDKRFNHSITIVGTDRSLLDSADTKVAVHALGISGRSYNAFLQLKKIFEQGNVDIVHVNNLAPWFDCLLAAKIVGCRCVQTFHGVEQGDLSFSLLRKTLYRLSARFSDTITAVAEPAALLLSDLTGIDRDRIQIIPNGVDTSLFAPAATSLDKSGLRKEKGLPEDRLLFGCVAALRPVKNHYGLLQAFAEAFGKGERGATLVLAGEGSLEGDLKITAKSLGIEEYVLFLGRREDVPELLRCFDVFVLNSNTEGLSYAVLEAMASGLPVVATAVGENIHLIKDGEQGFLVPPDNTEALKKTLLHIAKDTAGLVTMGAKTRKLVMRQYSLQGMVSAYRQLYETLAK